MSYSALPYNFLPKNVDRLTFALDPRLSSVHLISTFMLRLTCKQNTSNPKHAYVNLVSLNVDTSEICWIYFGWEALQESKECPTTQLMSPNMSPLSIQADKIDRLFACRQYSAWCAWKRL